jgi:hypothetical protein
VNVGNGSAKKDYSYEQRSHSQLNEKQDLFVNFSKIEHTPNLQLTGLIELDREKSQAATVNVDKNERKNE